MAFDFTQATAENAVIRIIGVGERGISAVELMIEHHLVGVEYVTVSQVPSMQMASKTCPHIQLHGNWTPSDDIPDSAPGANPGSQPGSDPRSAADLDSEREKDLEAISRALEDADLVLVVYSSGCQVSRSVALETARKGIENGALTVGIVSTPVCPYGPDASLEPERQLNRFLKVADSAVVIPADCLGANEKDPGLSPAETFLRVDEAIMLAVRTITDIITVPGLVGTDFADVKTILTRAGPAAVAFGSGMGRERWEEATRRAISFPLSIRPISDARRILILISGPEDMGIPDVNKACSAVQGEVFDDANIIFGVVTNSSIPPGMMSVGIIAVGFPD